MSQTPSHRNRSFGSGFTREPFGDIKNAVCLFPSFIHEIFAFSDNKNRIKKPILISIYKKIVESLDSSTS